MGSLEELTKYYSKQDLTGEDIQALTGKAPVIYSDLKNYATLTDLLGQENFAIILYQTSSKTTGHWVMVCCNKKTNDIVYFDSYGLHYDTEQQYGAAYDKPLPRYLTQLIEGDGRPIKINQYDYQRWAKGVSTCGRWSCIAEHFLKYITLQQFQILFTTNQSALLNQPDIAATLLTVLGLRNIPQFFEKS
jgi:hypothetical protein